MQADILDALRRGANEDALSLARAATTAHPEDPQAHRALAMALRASGDGDAALASIDRAIALAPDDADLHFHRAGYLLHGSRFDAAQAALSQTVQLDPNQYGAYVMQAQMALMRGDLDEAERQARLAARVSPEHPWTRLLQGSIALERDDADTALVLLSQAMEAAPEDAQIRYALGFAYLKKGHLAFAEQAFRSVLEKMPSTRGVRALLAELLRRQDRPAEAADELAPLLDRDDATPGLRRFAGQLELMAGRNERALPLLRQALAAQPDDPRTLDALYEALRRNGDRDLARNVFDAARATSPQAAMLWQARLATEDAADPLALEVAARWLERMPESLPALEANMALLGMRRDAEGAEAMAHRIVALVPEHRLAQMRIADRLVARDPDAGFAHIDSLLARTQDAEARFELRKWLGHAQHRAGRLDAAVATWLGLHVEAASRRLPLPEPTDADAALPPLVAPAADAPPVAFLAGAPGSGVERLAAILAGTMPAFRGDRFVPQRSPEDLLQGFNLPARLAGGELDAAAVAADWREHLPRRGIANGEVIDWLLWWDNALLPMLLTQLPQAHVLLALRDPRDMLLDWLAFDAPLRLRVESPLQMAQWLARHVEHVAVLHEREPLVYALVKLDEIHDDGGAIAAALGAALRANIATPPPGIFGPPHFAAGRWREFAGVLAEPFAQLAPVARRLGYPDA
jgi:Flp pilus assembly protein TadD